MAKMFYTLDEAKAALGKSDEEIKQLAREGRLREFRDGAKLMFKADQIEQLKGELGGGGAGGGDDAIGLEPSDSGLGIGMMDTRAASGSMSGISLLDTDASGRSAVGSGLANLPTAGIPSGSGAIGLAGSGMGSGSIGMAGSGLGSGITGMGGAGSGQMGISGSGAIGMNLKDDTALAADLGLSGSVGGMPSPGRSGTASALNMGSGSRSGVDVFTADESVDRADPMAQTAISSNVNEQINLEGVGSGSGLLDLTRESDDTSLGAELLDEIAPNQASGSGTGMRRAVGDSRAGSTAGMVINEPRGPLGRNMLVQQVDEHDPMAAAFGGAALGAAAVLLFAAFAMVTGLLGTHPLVIQKLGSAATGGFSFLIVVAMALALPVVFFVIGMVVGK